MKSHYRAVVIGGGIVGVSVLYHLAKLGWTDVALIERRELTAGSTWHAAAGFHSVNADFAIAELQRYTIALYRELQAESEQSLGLKFTGAITFAGTDERWEGLQTSLATFRSIGLHDAALLGPEEISRFCPIVDTTGLRGGLWDPNDGYLDPSGTTHAFAAAARRRGAEVILRNAVLALHATPEGTWRIVTEAGTITAEHVVNAAGLWARRVGRMAGVDLPVVPMEHHYLVTEPIRQLAGLDREIPTMVDLEGFTYARQEGRGLLLGVYERDPRHWHPEGAPWEFGTELIPEDVDRISPELTLGFARYPVLQETGIRRWVNGPFTFTPDGNPLVGPVPGLRNYWSACGVMAGFSQGGGVGLALARWMIEGEPGADVFGMDVARYGPFASNARYLEATTRQFYARRFLISYPNEQLPAGRPLRVPPAYDVMAAEGACFGVSWGLEVPLYFGPKQDSFVEQPSLKRSNAFPLIAAECRAARETVALLDTSAVSRFEVTGHGARAALDRLLACHLPLPGRLHAAPMLGRSGHLMGDLTVLDWGDDTMWLMGSYHLRAWHKRWFDAVLQSTGVAVTDISDGMPGVAISGPGARALLAAMSPDDVSDTALPVMACRLMDVGASRARVARLSATGELGYEINVPAAEHRQLYGALLEAGRDLGLRQVGLHSLNALRLEKSTGIWSREFTQAVTPAMSGLDRFVAYDKPDFIGRDAALRDRDRGTPPRRLVTLAIEAFEADAAGVEPVWAGLRLVGQITSGGYGHTIGQSLAMAYVDAAVAHPGQALAVDVVGVRRTARVIPPSPVDPDGLRMRA